MNITDFVIILILVFILGVAITYMKKAKQQGVTCIGCADAKNCAKKRSGESCSCK